MKPFDVRVHCARGHSDKISVSSVFREMLADSGIIALHADCGRVQDPYSIQCIPQVMGACLDNLYYAARALTIEANVVSDNSLVFTDSGEAISNGNFHGEPVAFATKVFALAVAEIGSISER